MRITKILETTIDLTDPSDIYQHDIESLLLKKLNDRYHERCYQNIFIIGVNKIIRRSDIIMVDNQLNGGAYIDVQFEVEGIIFIEGEIITGCKIIEIHSNAITAEHKYAGIILKKEDNKIFSILSIGMEIPIVVNKVRYIPNKKTVSMIGVPFIPKADEENTFYNVTNKLDPESIEKLGYIFDMIEKEKSLHEGNIKNIQSYKFFQDLLYPYKNIQRILHNPVIKKGNFSAVAIDMKSMINIDKGIIIYPNEEPKQNSLFFWSKNDNLQIDDYNIINIAAFPLLAGIANKYLIYLYSLKNLVEFYNSPEIMSSLMTYWKLCKNAKV